MYNEAKLKSQLQEVLSNLENYLKQVRTGRPNPSIFESIRVEAYNTTMDIRSLGSISVDSASGTIFITPFGGDKTISEAIVKGVQAADLGYNPQNEGNRVKVLVPPLTEETRQKIVDQMNLTVEEKYRKWIRSLRADFMRELDRLEGVSEDAVASSKKQVQKHVDDTMAELEEMVDAKSQEVKPD